MHRQDRYADQGRRAIGRSTGRARATIGRDLSLVAYGQPEISTFSKVDEVPYDFVRKRLSVVAQTDEGRLLITKGALDNVLAVCAHLHDGEAGATLDAVHRDRIRAQFEDWSSQGFRVLGVATKPVPPQPSYTRADEYDLTFLGFLLFFDPPQPGVRETIEDLAKLGVGLKIITGDNRLVALHTAETVGLEVTGVLTGAELNHLSDEALWHTAERANLFVEVDPNQKERIIRALQKTRHVVGYMGDGINDAPALHAAEVGISVDQAVDVAKEAARYLLITTLMVAGVTLVLPYSPLSTTLGFTPLPAAILLVLGFIAVLYVATSELVKRIFYKRTRS